MKLFSAALFITFSIFSYSHAQNFAFSQLESFRDVWSTVDKNHFDPTKNGVDWHAMYDRYKTDIYSIRSNHEFIYVVNHMLFEMQQSHALVASEEMLRVYMPTLFSPATIGIDICWDNGEAIISRVRKGFPGSLAGLEPGFEIIKIDGQTIESIVNSYAPLPPFNNRNYIGGLSGYLTGHLDGLPGTQTSVIYSDQKTKPKKVVIKRRSRGEGIIVNSAMPPVYVEYESQLLNGDIIYVWFNHFATPVDKKYLDTLRRFKYSKGMIIDLRGNPGGYFKVMDTILETLIKEEMSLYHFRLREKKIKRIVKPAEIQYKKPVVVIIDQTSMSSSELFASCLQAIGGAVLLGSQSPGYLLGAQWKRLTNGVSFMYPFLQPIPLNGYIVENNGVIPDIMISFDKDDLLEGKDPRIEAAVKYILIQ